MDCDIIASSLSAPVKWLSTVSPVMVLLVSWLPGNDRGSVTGASVMHFWHGAWFITEDHEPKEDEDILVVVSFCGLGVGVARRKLLLITGK